MPKKADRFGKTGELLITLILSALIFVFVMTLANYIVSLSKLFQITIDIPFLHVTLDSTLVLLIVLLAIILLLAYFGIIKEKLQIRVP